MAAKKGNKYAEVWSKPVVLHYLEQIYDDVENNKLVYLGIALANIGLYSRETRQLYTPEEFYSIYSRDEYTNHRISAILENIVIRDPIGGIEAGHKQLQNLKDKNRQDESALGSKLEAFAKKSYRLLQQKKILNKVRLVFVLIMLLVC